MSGLQDAALSRVVCPVCRMLLQAGLCVRFAGCCFKQGCVSGLQDAALSRVVCPVCRMLL